MSKNYEFGRKNSDFCLRIRTFFVIIITFVVRTKAQAQAQAQEKAQEKAQATEVSVAKTKAKNTS